MNVSAVIPTFNRGQYVFRAIDSVLAQTARVGEVIVVDDGSTDGTAEAVRSRYGSRVTVFRQANRGVSTARTRGVAESRGDWVAFLDSDDVWLPTKLERQFDALTAAGNDFGVCFTNCRYFGNPDLRRSTFEEVGLPTDPAAGHLDNPVKYIVGRYLGIHVPSLLVLRSLVTGVGGFDDGLGISEDRDLIFRLAFKTKFCFVSEPLLAIDRTESLPRLTGLLAHKDDQSYAWLERPFRKWLASPDLVDNDARRMIQEELIALYYGWAAERLSGLRLPAAIGKINEIRHMGHSYPEIVLALMSRAAGKLSRTLRPRGESRMRAVRETRPDVWSERNGG